MKTIATSAPGKLLLMGDHAVVYGGPCLVTAVSERMTVTLAESSDDGVHFVTPGVSDTRFLTAALSVAREYWHAPLSKFTLEASSTFSGNYGLGSSAAVTVAALFAFAAYLGKRPGKEELFRLAYKVVLDVQRVGSGFDVASAIWGGTIWYEHLGKNIVPVLSRDMPLVVGFTGTKANTAAMVSDVAKKYDSQTERVTRIFTAIETLVSDAKKKIIEGDWERVGKLMEFNQEYLRDLGVSSEKLESLISAAKQAGAWGAKLSGAGGGDCMIALVSPEKKEQVEEAIQAVGGQVIHISPNAPGVRRES